MSDTKPLSPRYKISDPSLSIDEINIPEISNQSAEFIYNYYVYDERVKPYNEGTKNLALDKIPRYVLLKWKSPILSAFEASIPDSIQQSYNIELNASKILSEDNFFNPGFLNYTFSNINGIEQGASDIEVFSKISGDDSESVMEMSKHHLKQMTTKDDLQDESYIESMGSLAESYSTLADFPKQSLGLRVYDAYGNLSDNDDLLRSITESLSLSMKINAAIIPDIFEESTSKLNDASYRLLSIAYSNRGIQQLNVVGLSADPVQRYSRLSSATETTNPVKLIGYIVDKYSVASSGFKKENTFYIEDIKKISLVDKDVLYGVTYIYTIRVIADVKLLTYTADMRSVDLASFYISSRPVSVPVECYEYSPPPEPNDLRFFFDYVKRNLLIKWDTPVNPQKDIKQFQVFRRKSINEPFELIAQYGFDRSVAGSNGKRYTTGEKVDANNIQEMSSDLRHLVQDANSPVYYHVDNDFTVDSEFNISSAYIYSICSIDAHGMISNYSTQHHVTFDPYKNKLIVTVVCDAGSPRQYPNMNLRMDAFKDVIKASGDSARQLDVYFTPEYVSVKDSLKSSLVHKVIETQGPQDQYPYYLLQLINTDNQKLQLIKVNIKETTFNRTSSVV